MKTKLLMKTMLLLCALVVGSSNMWAQSTKTEGFETKATSTTYNSTVAISASESDCSISWSIYYGCVSTNDKISGSNSAQMRWYSNATSNYPYVKTTTAIDGLSNVALKARTDNTNVKMAVCYSTNGTDWTVGKTHTFSKTGKGEDVSLAIPSGNKYLKFEVSSSSTAPTSGNYKLIVDDVVFTYTSSLTTPTWSLSPASAIVEMGDNADLQLTTNYDGTLSFDPVDDDVATVSYNSSTKVVTVTGVSPGSTSITVTGAATATYEAISKSISVTVTHPELASNFTDVLGPLGYTYFGLTPTGSNKYVEPDVTSTDKTDAYDVAISWARNGSSYSKPRFDEAYTRFYNGNTFTVTAPTGSTIRKIVFTEPSKDKAWAGSMTANYGDYVSSEKTWYATTEDVTSVVFTNDNTKRIGGLKVYLTVPPVSAALAASGYTTLVSMYPLNLSTVTNLDKAFVVSAVTKTTATLDEVTTVPANTGIILKGTANAPLSIPVATYAGEALTNMLEGSATEAASVSANSVYVISGGQFKLFTGTEIAKGKAYLSKPAEARDFLNFSIDDETTDIDASLVNSEKRIENSEVYDLQGRRVAQTTKGLYIVNGKKVVIK